MLSIKRRLMNSTKHVFREDKYWWKFVILACNHKCQILFQQLLI